MVYAYQIFGNYFRDENEIKKISDLHRSSFEKIPRLKSNYVFSKIEDEVVSVLYVCDDKQK